MKKRTRIARTDSIEKLARFWDTHDVTDFEDALEEVKAPVFERKAKAVIKIGLQRQQMDALKKIAKSKGIKQADLVRKWVMEKLRAV